MLDTRQATCQNRQRTEARGVRHASEMLAVLCLTRIRSSVINACMQGSMYCCATILRVHHGSDQGSPIFCINVLMDSALDAVGYKITPCRQKRIAWRYSGNFLTGERPLSAQVNLSAMTRERPPPKPLAPKPSDPVCPHSVLRTSEATLHGPKSLELLASRRGKKQVKAACMSCRKAKSKVCQTFTTEP